MLNKLLQAVLEPLANAPSSPVQGQIYYDTTLNRVRYYDGTAWVYLDTRVDDITLEFDGSNLLSIKNKGVTFIKIQDINTSTLLGRVSPGTGDVEEVTLDADTNLAADADDRVPTQRAVKAYVDSLIAGIGQFVGGYDASANTDFPSTGSGTGGAVEKGDYWRITAAGTLGTTNPLNVQAGDVLIANVDGASTTDGADWFAVQANVDVATETAPGLIEIATQAEVDAGVDDQRAVTPLKLKNYTGSFSTTIGDGASTSFTVTHNLNTENVQVSMRETNAPKESVLSQWNIVDANNVSITFDAAPGLNEFTVTVSK